MKLFSLFTLFFAPWKLKTQLHFFMERHSFNRFNFTLFYLSVPSHFHSLPVTPTPPPSVCVGSSIAFVNVNSQTRSLFLQHSFFFLAVLWSLFQQFGAFVLLPRTLCLCSRLFASGYSAGDLKNLLADFNEMRCSHGPKMKWTRFDADPRLRFSHELLHKNKHQVNKF